MRTRTAKAIDVVRGQPKRTDVPSDGTFLLRLPVSERDVLSDIQRLARASAKTNNHPPIELTAGQIAQYALWLLRSELEDGTFKF